MSSSYYYGIAIDNDSSENHMQLFLWEFFYQFRDEGLRTRAQAEGWQDRKTLYVLTKGATSVSLEADCLRRPRWNFSVSFSSSQVTLNEIYTLIFLTTVTTTSYPTASIQVRFWSHFAFSEQRWGPRSREPPTQDSLMQRSTRRALTLQRQHLRWRAT